MIKETIAYITSVAVEAQEPNTIEIDGKTY